MQKWIYPVTLSSPTVDVNAPEPRRVKTRPSSAACHANAEVDIYPDAFSSPTVGDEVPRMCNCQDAAVVCRLPSTVGVTAAIPRIAYRQVDHGDV